MNWQAIRALTRRDLMLVRRSRALMVPLVLVPVMLLVLLPLVLSLFPALMGEAIAAARLEEVLSVLPPAVQERLGHGPPAERWTRVVHLQLLPSLFVIVPFMVANVIAADSFAGERERKTLEALLFTPLTDAELLIGKLLAAWLPAMIVNVIGFVLTSAVVATATYTLFGRPLLPDSAWMLLASWVAPAFTAVGLAAMVLISLHVRGTQEVMQLGGLLVLPAIALLVGQIRGALLLGPGVLYLVGLALWAISAGLVVLGIRGFRRTRLVTLL